ncbi:TonB-dependent siderophore receptor, partial [Pseudomonas syringae pv. actinidiae ICMP 19079]
MPTPFSRLRPSRVKTLGLSLGGLVLALAFQGEVLAEEFDFDIPAQALNSALKELGRQGDLQILYNPDDVNGKLGSAVHGRLTPEQAVADLLKKADVAHSFEANTLILGIAASAQPMNLGPVAIKGDHFGITTEGSGSYAATGVIINKTSQSLRDTAQSVTVVTRQLMNDKNLTGLDEVMAQTPGITFSQRNFGSHVFSSRGFALEDESYTIDGVAGQGYSVTGWMTPDMEIYDRVEVLRGAAGL